MKLAALFDFPISATIASLDVDLITSDSREATIGSLFFALDGVTRDGHDFVVACLEKGAIAAVIRKGHPFESALGVKFADRVIAVQDVRGVLGEAASRFYGRPAEALTVCGVTGTNGKTTSTYLLEAILQEWGKPPAVIGTVENRLGSYRVAASHTTPDAIHLQKLLRDFADHGARALAMEVSSHALDQKRVAGMHFDATLFTNLTQDHLDYHHTLDQYFGAKVRLFTDYPVRVRAIHVEDAFGKRLAELCRKRGFEVITFGRNDCNVNYGELSFSAKGIEGDLELSQTGRVETLHLKSPLIGGFNVQNLAGVVAVAFGLGVPLPKIASALSHARQVPGRMENVTSDARVQATVVVDYSHTPDALEKALKTLREICTGRLLCVFGCGGDRDPGKRPIMGRIAGQLADLVFVTSDNPRTEEPEHIIDAVMSGIKSQKQVQRISDRRKAIAAAIAIASPGDIVLVAGKGHEDYQIIGTQKTHFDDREVAREYLAMKTQER